MIKGLKADVERTKALQAVSGLVNASCCPACAVHLHAVALKAYPAAFVEDLIEAGVDPARPREVWGEPNDGFLAGWYLAAGDALGNSVWAEHPKREFESVGGGLEIWVGKTIKMRPDGLEGEELVEIEFVWQSDKLKALTEAAWPRVVGGRGG